MNCPYCNHSFEAAATGRVECPRCGEVVLARAAEGGEAPAVFRNKAPAFNLAGMVKTRLKYAFIVTFLIMLVLSGIAYKLTIDQKRVREARQLQDQLREAPSELVTAPIELRGLRHIPTNSNVVVAVQPGPLLVYAERTGQDPVDLLTKNGIPASMLGSLANAGIALRQIDHLVAGIHVPDKDEEPRIAVVLIFRYSLPNRAAAFLEGLKAKPTDHRRRHEVQLDKLSLRMHQEESKCYVFGLSDKDLVGSPPSGRFRELIETRVPKDAALWVTADDARWSDKPILQLMKKEWQPLLAKGRAAALALSFGESPRLRVNVQCADHASGEQLRSYFKGKATGERSSAGGEGDWATLAKPVEPAEMLATLKRLMGE